MEAFLKLPAILFNIFDTNSVQFKLWKCLKDFTVLSLAKSLTESDLEEMRSLSDKIINFCLELVDMEVFCKLHHLVHYADLIVQFGPLYYFSTFRYERKHQYCKYIARVMRNFINPSKTIHERHQVRKALIEKKIQFRTFEFFKKKARLGEPHFESIGTTKEKREEFASKFEVLLSCERPFPLNKQVLRRCNSSIYFHVEQFYREIKTGKIFCSGEQFSNHWNTKFDSRVRKQVQFAREKRRKDGLKCLTRNRGKYVISYEELYPTNDFLFESNKSYFLLESGY